MAATNKTTKKIKSTQRPQDFKPVRLRSPKGRIEIAKTNGELAQKLGLGYKTVTGKKTQEA